jgi:hypothetical protein
MGDAAAAAAAAADAMAMVMLMPCGSAAAAAAARRTTPRARCTLRMWLRLMQTSSSLRSFHCPIPPPFSAAHSTL